MATTTAPASPAQSQAPVLEIKGLSKRFKADGPLIIDNLNLTIKPGEFVSLVGASGCGKSTLLNILSGLDVLSSGSVELNAQPSLMFQEHALLPWLTAGKNIELALKLVDYPKAERKARAQQLLELVHLPHAYKLRPHELSGGMRQRVAIARALAQGRKFLLMDEPFAALDAITRDLLHDELISIWEETGLTVLFVTHNVREAVRLGQRVILMSSRPGRIIHEWQVAFEEPRRIESHAVGELSTIITEELRKEIKRHGH
ncbi:MAG: hypothetical protein RL508_350 [Actinomycetota bacterium]|jgi:NitT/TauT family transport system ATP-binding protein